VHWLASVLAGGLLCPTCWGEASTQTCGEQTCRCGHEGIPVPAASQDGLVMGRVCGDEQLLR
jgi:hypothetical protein